MSLFKWSSEFMCPYVCHRFKFAALSLAPERRIGDRILPIIPNEIYLHVLDHIARPTGPLEPEELREFTTLSRVCRFFANVCLPRIFELVEFSGSMFDDDIATTLRNDAICKASRMNTLCTQIVAKRPLALALVKTVKACRFTDWTLDDTGSWAVRLFAKKYIDGMSHMINIRKLEFSNSFVDTDHWNAIATLASLEELSFNRCDFLGGPADVEPDEWVKIKLTRLCVTDCEGVRQPIAATDPRSLRTLDMDGPFLEEVDWLPQSALTELYFRTQALNSVNSVEYIEQLHTVLTQVPKSLEAIWLYVDTSSPIAQDIVGRIFDDPEWKNLPLVRSLTLEVPVMPWLDQVCQSSSSILYCSLTRIPVHFLSLGGYRSSPKSSIVHTEKLFRHTGCPTH